ncbi:putative F-box/LRR-repeat protein [Nymphaea thermarum]|nr:putative F-box/LRR-repeat protein [Nymphaea thermarum]
MSRPCGCRSVGLSGRRGKSRRRAALGPPIARGILLLCMRTPTCHQTGDDLPLIARQLKDSSSGDAKPSECRINSLPESILLHILSFLTFKEAVKCSVLSKEWRHMYTAIPVID